MSGQCPNLTKSDMLFSNIASRDLKRSLSSKTGTRLFDQNITYLGNPLFIHKNKIRDFNFNLDKISQLTERWRSKFLSNVGKAILIK